MGELSPSELSPNEQYQAVRTLLFSAEQKQLKDALARVALLEERLENKAQRVKDVADVVPEAISARQEKDDSLGETIKPAVEAAVKESVKGNPNEMAEALFPIVGPVVRKSIEAALNGGADSEDDYLLQQIFLIHKETGLLLLHKTADDVETQDGDMVSGMLTAIQDFVHDAFNTSAHDGLNSLKVGALTVWIEWGPNAVLAVAIEGSPPENLREKIAILLEAVHHQYDTVLNEFDGDNDDLEVMKADFDQLCSSLNPKVKSKNIPLPLVLAGFALFGLFMWATLWIVEGQQWRSYLALLESEPGIVVTREFRRDLSFHVTGLLDPLAQSPQQLLALVPIAPSRLMMNWQPYDSHEPDLVLARAENVLKVPSGVNLELQNGTLIFPYNAPKAWLQQAESLALLVPGVKHIKVQEASTVSVEKDEP